MVLSKKLFLLLFLFLNEAAFSNAASLFSTLSSKDQTLWLKLLHFKPTRVNGQSLADGDDFFFSPNGKLNAEEELEQTLRAFREKTKVGRYKIEAACAFPARFEFLKTRGFHSLKKPSCPIFEKWEKEVDPESLTLVFSTAYPNNPASMFGHTFLRFNKVGKKNDLLDYGTAYSAIVDNEDWGVIYALKGIFGGYPGFFDLSLYYQKVNEYNHSESRDLIEYDLNIPKERVRFIFKHLWEIYNTTHFDYYFTLENCSYHLASLINVGIDDVIPEPVRWYYLPADLVQKIDQVPGLLGKAVTRPSLKKKIRASLTVLSEKEEDQVKNIWLKGKFKDEKLSASALDSLLLHMQNRKFSNKGKLNDEEKVFFQEMLEKRAKLGKNPKPAPKVELKNLPHQAHYAQKVYIGHNLGKYDPRFLLGFSSGYHDLLARDLGLEPFSRFEFLSIDAHFDTKKRDLGYNRFQLINIASLHPWRYYNSQLSWKVGVQWEEVKEIRKRNAHKSYAEGKLGISFGNDHILLALLAGVSGEHSSYFERYLDREFRFGPNGEIMLMANTAKNQKVVISSEIRGDILRKMRDEFLWINKAEGSVSLSKNMDLRISLLVLMANGGIDNTIDEVNMTFGYYF